MIYRGPNMNPVVVERLIETADGGRDSVPIGRQRPRHRHRRQRHADQPRPAWPLALVSMPNRYMHSPVEMISLDDIDHAADLLAGFVQSLKADDDFRP